jgi:hypothetical protein
MRALHNHCVTLRCWSHDNGVTCASIVQKEKRPLARAFLEAAAGEIGLQPSLRVLLRKTRPNTSSGKPYQKNWNLASRIFGLSSTTELKATLLLTGSFAYVALVVPMYLELSTIT